MKKLQSKIKQLTKSELAKVKGGDGYSTPLKSVKEMKSAVARNLL